MNDSDPGVCRIFEEISKHSSIAMPNLAAQLGLKVSGVENRVRKLRRLQLVVPGDARGEIALNRNYGWVAGIDMGASHLHLALADFRGEIARSLAVKVQPEDGPRKMIGQIKKSIRKLVPSGNKSRLRALALAVPSAVDPRTGLVLLANNLPGWTNIDLKDELQKELQVPVAIENDANMAALGEHWRGVARTAGNFIFIALGTGIGSGIFVNGRLYVGRAGAAGELYLMNVEWRRWQEDFGSTGHFESYASGLGISRLGQELLKTRVEAGRDSLAEKRDARFVFEAFHRGDAGARRALETAFTVLGVGIANVVAVLDPEMIVLGGGISRGAPDFMLRTLNQVAKKIQPGCPPICLSALGDKAQTYGAIFRALTATCHEATRYAESAEP
jgi:glucokinase